MKTLLLLITLLLSLNVESWAQKSAPSPAKLTNAAPCVPRQTPNRIKRPVAQTVVPAPVEPAAEFFVGEAMVEVTKDQTVVRLAMSQHASVLIELPANDGPRYIIPGDPEMVTVDEKALERNKRAIIVRPGALFVMPLPGQKKRLPAATVTAQMRSGLVVTFLFYPVADLAQNVHRCVLNYKRDEVVARRRAAGLPVNLDQKEQGGDKPTGQSGAPASISVEPVEEAKATDTAPSTRSAVTPTIENTAKPADVKPNATPVSNGKPTTLASGLANLNEHAVAAAKKQLARATAEPGTFKNWTRPLHGLVLAALQDGDVKENFRVLLLAVKNAGAQPLKLIPGTPDLTLEMHDDKGKVINVQSIKSLHTEISDSGGEVGAGRTVYYAIAYTPPLMGVRHRLKIVVAQTNAADEPASIALLNK
jgi:hypothetical protein